MNEQEFFDKLYKLTTSRFSKWSYNLYDNDRYPMFSINVLNAENLLLVRKLKPPTPFTAIEWELRLPLDKHMDVVEYLKLAGS